MEIILILILITFISLFFYAIFKLIKWVLKDKIRTKRTLILFSLMAVFYIINLLFFIKMEFIQSKAIPNLYLIKNPIENKDSLHKAIEKIILEKVNQEFIKNKDKYKHKVASSNDSISEFKYSIDFYQYYKGSVFIPFGDAGTYYFIENEEDPGGFSVEVLDMYPKYHIAQFNLKFCKNDTVNYFGTIDYYKEWDVIKTDTLINLCK